MCLLTQNLRQTDSLTLGLKWASEVGVDGSVLRPEDVIDDFESESPSTATTGGISQSDRTSSSWFLNLLDNEEVIRNRSNHLRLQSAIQDSLWERVGHNE